MRPRVAVIMGGYTSEHNISMKSGAVVMAHIDRDAYEVYAVHIDKDVWLVEINGNWKPIDISDFSCDDIKFDVFSTLYMVHLVKMVKFKNILTAWVFPTLVALPNYHR
ncbi:MAG: hypothetical protein CM15mP83_6340 [Flavobacteriaceae bacterium]|nr:MAG: hypothetical protein CM15mP83_6340 [Flavobacteriaceae bacterium]